MASAGAASTEMVKVLRAVAPVPSVTRTVSVDVPTAVGVPTMRTSGLLGRVFFTKRVPAGTLPDISVNLKVEGPGGSLAAMEAR